MRLDPFVQLALAAIITVCVYLLSGGAGLRPAHAPAGKHDDALKPGRLRVRRKDEGDR